ncbi:AGE family epimerase/isomerase [Pleomorphomonas oryzae]|uniref:AGE family epimerase/isomerase n=1 Tax=Pleomorphomonas oryzae TaxID=261934 RepID=UPI000404526B|nr:AGE family epimerase/isomerase [Pleomorphomonas oryzae]
MATDGKGRRAEVLRELTDNILPFWHGRMRDPQGGFFGAADCNGIVDKGAPRASVVNARILWTFATATRVLGASYRATADWAFDYLRTRFLDGEHGGIHWLLDAEGHPVSDRKQIYAQAFAIYAFSEYARATGDRDSLKLAIDLFRLIEKHAADRERGGYIEALDRAWGPLSDMRLSDKDLNSPKSMNTHLHIMEAYTNLLRIWRDPALVARQAELIAVTLDRVVDGQTGHFKLFFDMDWRSLNDHISYGHDIEGSWLLVEAAEVLGNEALIARARAAAILMAERTLAEGRDADGSLHYEAHGDGRLIDADKHWWPQAEALVGFQNAWDMTGNPAFGDAVRDVWAFIRDHVADRAHGEWHAKLTPDGRPYTSAEDADACLAGPWKCPYHNSRACFEMLERLKG